MNGFGNILKKLRKERGLSQKELADRLKLSRSSVAMYEQGEREASFETLENIADFFNVDMDYLLGRKIKQRDNDYTSYEILQSLIARNGKTLSTEQKQEIIKILLNEAD